MVGAAALVGLVLRALGRPRLGLAPAVGVLSHLVLDLLTHDHDLVLAPGLGGGLGLGLYGSAPMAAFLLELAYGVVCWRVFRGGRMLLAASVLFNGACTTRRRCLTPISRPRRTRSQSGARLSRPFRCAGSATG